MKTAKTCSYCRKPITHPMRGTSFVIEINGNDFRRKLCPECVEAGWRFDKRGLVVRKEDLATVNNGSALDDIV